MECPQNVPSSESLFYPSLLKLIIIKKNTSCVGKLNEQLYVWLLKGFETGDSFQAPSHMNDYTHVWLFFGDYHTIPCVLTIEMITYKIAHINIILWLSYSQNFCLSRCCGKLINTVLTNQNWSFNTAVVETGINWTRVNWTCHSVINNNVTYFLLEHL